MTNNLQNIELIVTEPSIRETHFTLCLIKE